MSVLEMVPLDIETTGFNLGDEVTTIGFELELGCRVFLQTGGRHVDDGEVEEAVRDRTGRHVVVSTHESERALLVSTWEFVGDRLRGEDVMLVGYNAELWRGGFDLPFLRSRCAAQDVPWPFVDLPYADLMPIVTDRFNTTIDGDAQSDLESAYAAMCGGELNDVDPFADSEQAVAAFQDGEFAALVTHNAADIMRTGAIGTVAKQYCSKSDFDLKSLTPVIEDA
jgi:uncharacterized protein YprB with RNaseH-like and TPR domain